jgi:hypothetical protein
MRRFLYLSSVFFFLAFGVSNIGNAQASSKQGDESGTLILIARTKSAVIISVDSKITQSSAISLDKLQKMPINPARKLVDVGDKSACVLDGNLGIEGEESDVAPALRSWVVNHPHVEADKALDNLSAIVVEAWNKRGFRVGDKLPLDRKPGSLITRLVCAGFADRKFFIVEGHTEVNADISARWISSPPSFESFYLSGVLHTDSLYSFVMDRGSSSLRFTPEVSEFYTTLVDAVSQNDSAIAAFDDWKKDKTQTNICLLQNAGKITLQSQCSQLNWTELEVKNLFTTIFKSVEEQKSDIVACPNNARVIRSCGRLPTLVETISWESCKPSSARSRKLNGSNPKTE